MVKISIKSESLKIHLKVGCESWERKISQPISLSAEVSYFSNKEDKYFDYCDFFNAFEKCKNKEWTLLEDINIFISNILQEKSQVKLESIKINCTKHNPPINSENNGVTVSYEEYFR